MFTNTFFDPRRTRENMRRLFEDAIGQGRPELVDRYVADGATHHTDSDDVDLADHLRELVPSLRDACPDLRVHVNDIVGDEHLVALRVTMTGKPLSHLWFGLSIAGRHESYHFVRCDAFGRATAMWSSSPMDEMLQQIYIAGARSAA
jgi:predicted ester cyclase